jgi:peptide/nickel transport system permease protein
MSSPDVRLLPDGDPGPAPGGRGPLPRRRRPAAPPGTSRAAMVRRRLLSMPRFWVGASILLLMVLWALFGNAPNIYGPADQDPFALSQSPSLQHWFGTDRIGQDLYAQVNSGLRKSLVIGLFAGLLGTAIAAVVGSVAGYLGGKVETVIVWFINFLLVLPAFYILLLFAPALRGLSWVAIIGIVALFSWMVTAQVVKAQTKSLRDREFVKAARFMGLSTPVIIARHVLPNVASLLIVDATLGVVGAILAETSLSYFGLGVQPPDVSLGTLLAAGTPGAVTRPWVFAFPALALVLTLTATSIMADALRDAIDPTSGAGRA